MQLDYSKGIESKEFNEFLYKNQLIGMPLSLVKVLGLNHKISCKKETYCHLGWAHKQETHSSFFVHFYLRVQ